MRLPFTLVALVSAACAPPPQLVAVEPTQGPTAQEVALVVTGHDLVPGLTLELVGQAFRFALRVDEVAADQVRAVIPAGVDAARYDLVVRNPDGADDRLAAAYQAVDAVLTVVVLDVGQGASLLAVGSDGSSLLVDGGKEGRAASVLRPALARYSQGQLDTVVVTHFDVDHMGGIAEWMEGPDGLAGTDDDPALPGGLWDNGGAADCTTDICRRYRVAAAGRAHTIVPGQTFALGAASARCVIVGGHIEGGPQLSPADDNASSVGLLFEMAGKRVLVSGDLPGGGLGSQDFETPLAQVLGPIDVWHLNHHGSATATAQSALDLHAPRLALIPVDTDNAYCHPAQEVVDRLQVRALPVYLTGAGTVTPSTACPQTTQLGPQMKVVGEIRLEIDAAGALTVNGAPL
ncbi:MAG: MBL fold metallo-hydrolase [Pseudomonadota bacterium]